MSLLLALLWHILHCLRLLLLGLLHFFWVHILHELSHQESNTNHDNKWILEVGCRIKWFLFLEIGDFGTWIKLEWVNEAKVFSVFYAEQECFRVLAR